MEFRSLQKGSPFLRGASTLNASVAGVKGGRSNSLVARLMPNARAPDLLRYSVCNLSLRPGLQAQSVSIVMLLCASWLGWRPLNSASPSQG